MSIKRKINYYRFRFIALLATLPFPTTLFFWKKFTPLQRRYFQVGTIGLLVVLLPILFMIYERSKAEAAWYNNNWAYRQAITITNSTGAVQNSFEYLITLDTATLITNSKMQDGCQDIRVTSPDGNELAYYVAAGCNTTTTQIWINIDSFKTGSNVFYLYYGNPSVGSKSSASSFKTLNYLAGYWPLNEGSTSTANDASGNNKPGTLSIGQGGTQTTTTQAWDNGATGKVGRSLNFDGTDDSIQFLVNTLVYVPGKVSSAVAIQGDATSNGDASSFSFSNGSQVSGNRYTTIDGNQGSVSFWYKPTYAYNTTVDRVIFEFPSLMKLTYNNATQKFDFGYWNGSNYTAVKVSSLAQTFPANTWLYIAVTWNSDNSPYLQMKVNNQAIQQYTSGTFTVQTPQATNYIGADSNSQNSAAGSLDDFIITAYPLRQIESGTVTNTGATVTGSSTSFSTLSTSGYQDSFVFSDDTTVYTVNSVSSDTSLKLSDPRGNHTSATSFQAGQMTALYNGGNGSAATLVESHQRLLYATMDNNGNLIPANPQGATSANWTDYNSSTNTNGQFFPNGTMEAATGGLPTSWSKSSTPTTADASTANTFADTRTQSIAVTAISQGITLTSHITVSAGQRYKIGAWVKSDGTNRANLRIRNVTASSDIATLGTTSSGWQFLNTFIIIPTGMTSLNVFVESGTAASYTFYVDDIGMWKLP